MRKAFLLITIAIFLLSKSVKSQNHYLDSLKKILTSNIHDTIRLKTINFIIGEFVPESKEAIYYSNELGKIAYKNVFKKGNSDYLNKIYLEHIATFLNNKGNDYSHKRNPNALKCYNLSIKIFEFLNLYEDMQYALMGKGIYLAWINDFKGSLDCYFQALKKFEQYKNYDGVNYAISNIASSYHDVGNYKEAIQYYKKALNFYDTLSKPNMSDINQMSIININLGSSYLLQNNFTLAESSLNRGLLLAKKCSNNQMQSLVLSKIGLLNLKMKNPSKAISFYQEAILHSVDSLSTSNSLIRIGELYCQIKNYPKALSVLNKGLQITAINRNFELQEQAYYFLYKTYSALNQTSKALNMYEQYNKIKDSSKVNDAKNELIKQQLRYDYEKKELEVKLEQEKKLSAIKIENEKRNARKNIFLYAFIFLAIILGITVIYIYKFFKQKNIINANKNNELRQKLLLTQMNPHFIFNSVDNIQSLIHNNQNNEAITYLTKFSKLTRQILENSAENYITLEEELVMLDNYLSIQQLLYNKNFDYSIKIDSEIETVSILIPPMLSQPFIENAIKHGLKNKANGGMINICFFMQNNLLFFEVRDNGSGLEIKNKLGHHKSVATQIVSERLNNQKTKKEIEIQIENIYENKNIIGVKTLFEIPYIYDK